MSRKKGVKKGSVQAASYKVEQSIDRHLWTMQVIKYIKQECKDAMQIALDDLFEFPPEDQKRILDAFERRFRDISHIKLEDTDDQVYADTRIEGRLQEINGPNYAPKKERYSFTVIDPLGRQHSFEGVKCDDFL